MAKKILISTVVIGAQRYFAGSLLDVSAEAEAIAAVVAAGGQLLDEGDPIVDAASATARQMRKNGHWQSLDTVILSAVARSAHGASQGGSSAGPQRDLFVNLASSEVTLFSIGETTATQTPVDWGEGIRNGVVVFPVGWDGGDLLWAGTLRGEAVQETFLSPGAGGGTVVGTQLFTTVTSITNTAPAGGGAEAAEIQPGRLVGTTRAPLASVEKISVGGEQKTPASVDLTTGAVEMPAAVSLGVTVEIISVIA